MSSGSKPSTVPVESKAQLVEDLASGPKPRDAWRIGTEHEKFGYRLDDHSRLPYDGPGGIKAMLEGLQRFGWQPVLEKGNVIALSMGGASISLEPGGQFELSAGFKADGGAAHAQCDDVALLQHRLPAEALQAFEHGFDATGAVVGQAGMIVETIAELFVLGAYPPCVSWFRARGQILDQLGLAFDRDCRRLTARAHARRPWYC